MEINGEITLLFDEDGMSIEIRDDDASVPLCRGKLNPEQTMKALSRLGYCPMESLVIYPEALPKLGKIMEVKEMRFEISEKNAYTEKEKVRQRAIEVCPEGWEPDLHFGSRDSIFKEGDKFYARTHIRRWVEKEGVKDEESS